MRIVLKSMMVFAVTALVGPVICWIALYPVNRVSGIDQLYDLVYALVALLWPMWLLGVIEHNSGPIVAGIVAVGANVLLFLAVGCLAGIFARHSRFIYSAYAFACMLLFVLYARWSVSLLTLLDAVAFATAFLVYSVPFIIARRPTLRRG